MADGSFSPKRANGATAPWTTREIETLRQTYPGSVKAACEALPHRSRAAILSIARKNGIKNNRVYTVPPSTKRKVDPFRDARIAELFSGTPTRREILRCAEGLGISETTIRAIATQLGCIIPRLAAPPWTVEHDEMLESWAHLTPQYISKRFNAAGVKRSAASISTRLSLLKISRASARNERGLFNADQIAKGLGMSNCAVARWCATGKLKSHSEKSDQHTIKADDLLSFMSKYPQSFSLKKFNQEWFCTVVLASKDYA